MKNQLTARIFSFFVIFSMLFSALGMPNILARAATTVTVESVSPIFKGNSSSSSPYTISWSHTTGAGSNRLLLVGISYNAATNVSPVSAVSFTPGTGGSEIPLSLAIGKKLSWLYRFAYIYYSPSEPPSGTAGTIKVTFAASVQSWHRGRRRQPCRSRLDNSDRTLQRLRNRQRRSECHREWAGRRRACV